MEPMLAGVRVVEVAEWGFVPSASAVLADWGANVIKVEHPVRGDPLREVVSSGLVADTGDYDYMVEHFNRGKRSLGLDLAHADGRSIFLKLILNADVLVTSFLEPTRRKLGITYADLSPLNPRLVYAVGSGQGQRGPDAAKPGFDSISFWSRGGIAHMLTPAGGPLVMQSAAYGDVTAGLYIAGGVAAALYRRSVTGKGGTVDVSLLGTAIWTLGPDIMASHLLGHDPLRPAGAIPANPLVGVYATGDSRFIVLNMMQSDRYWADFCQALGRVDLITDPQFGNAEQRSENRAALQALIRDAFAASTIDDLDLRLTAHNCVWSRVQSPWEVARDPQTGANGYLLPNPDRPEGRLAASPVQYKNDFVQPRSGAPRAGQHSEEILQELGMTGDQIARLKSEGVVN